MASTFIHEQLVDVSANYKNTVFNAVAILFTGGVERITSLVTFKCPCVDPKELPEICSNVTVHREIKCMSLLNFAYGLSFIVAPAVGFFVLGLLLKQKLWKALTGHRYKKTSESHEKRKFYGTILAMMYKSLIYPATWVSLSLLDGGYLACALTALPYDLKNSYHDCWTVAQTEKPLTSSTYEANRRFSQTLGWILAAGFVVGGFIVYMFHSYYSSFTFYHGQFYKEIKRDEEKELKKQMRMMAEKEAAANVKQFLTINHEEMSKRLWDEVSSVYDFPCDREHLSHYTNLQQWANCRKEEKHHDDEDEPKLESFKMSRFQ